MPTAVNDWTGVGLNVTLPRAGKYRVEAEVRAAVVGGGFVTARFFNTTASAAVPQALRLVNQLNGVSPGTGANNTAPITAFITVSEPSVIRVEAMRGDAAGTQTSATITSGAAGQTWMGWEQIG